MESYSISFTLGKASSPHGANLRHNNRKFLAPNIDPSRTEQNVTYVRQDVQQAYHQLFDQAVQKYNDKQKQPCRRIQDYYQQIADGKREEAYYEAVIQFGDVRTSPCGSGRGEIAKKLLNEYMKEFQERNPNLHVFNAVLHLDEASPHLHINFIPFYTKGRKNGLSKGVSMKQALDEMGFRASGKSQNRLVKWEESERMAMESILQRHGYARDNKNIHRAHMTIEDYKTSQDEKRYREKLRDALHVTESDRREENIRRLKEQMLVLKHETEKLKREKKSPFKAFFYSVPEKQAFVQARLDELEIPYHETENGFEAQECYVEEIRRIEKEFSPKNNQREKLRNDVDRLLMRSKDFDELLDLLKKENYEIRLGKYISVKPKNGGSYFRLKSLGEHYSEFALKNRLREKAKFEQTVSKEIAEARAKSEPRETVLKTIKLYTITFTKGGLPMRKRNEKEPYGWKNDSEVNALLELNQKLNEGATLESLRSDFAEKEKASAEAERRMRKEEVDMRDFLELEEMIYVVFEGKSSKAFTIEQAKDFLKANYPNIRQDNYQNIDNLLSKQRELVRKSSEIFERKQRELAKSSDVLATAEKVFGGTFVQSLFAEEQQRRESDFVPNGIKSANGRGLR